MDKNDKIFCETHRCTISVSGCIKRQDRHKTHSPYAFVSIPLDPKCENCEQGKAVKKGNYKPYKEEVMRSTINAMYPDAIAKTNRGPGRPPKQETSGEQKPKGTTQPILEKACWICGKRFPVTVEHFRRHGFTADGFENRCRACVGKNNILQLDFSGNMDLLDKLKIAAASEFRTPELQIMAMIAKEA